MPATKKRPSTSRSAGRSASAKKTTSTASKRSTASKATAGNSTSSKGKTTTSHDAIRRWAEKRGGHPATVKRTTSDGEAGVLRIDFPGYRGQDSLQEISWDEFFEKFDEKNLAFLYQEKTATGKPSRFFKLISREKGKAKSRAK